MSERLPLSDKEMAVLCDGEAKRAIQRAAVDEVECLRADLAEWKAYWNRTRAELETYRREFDIERALKLKAQETVHCVEWQRDEARAERATWQGIAKELEGKANAWLDQRDEARAALEECVADIEPALEDLREFRRRHLYTHLETVRLDRANAALARARTVLGDE
jgi:hypothetical protein